MIEPLLTITGLTKRFGGLVVSDNLNLEINAGETHAVIGPNGAGKTTLINQIQGELRSDAGRTLFKGRDISNNSAPYRARLGIARTFQISSVFPAFSVLANVAIAKQASIGHSFRFWRSASQDESLLAPARDAIARVGLVDRTDAVAQDLSHGERRQLELAMVLATKPSLLLLDEPMAGMGLQDSAHMRLLLGELKQTCTILLVEHDMETVFSLADRVTVLVAGRNIATGNPDVIRANPSVREAYLGQDS